MASSHYHADRYPLGARLVHWLMACVIILAWCVGFYSVHLRGDVPRGPLLLVHKGLASTVIVLVVLRLLYRFGARRAYPPLPVGTARLQAWAAHGVHGLLYGVAMIAAPLTGWFWSSVAGKPILMLGFIALPPLAPANPALYDLARNVHVTVVWGAGVLIALHMLAVFKHAVIDRDGILSRML